MKMSVKNMPKNDLVYFFSEYCKKVEAFERGPTENETEEYIKEIKRTKNSYAAEILRRMCCDDRLGKIR